MRFLKWNLHKPHFKLLLSEVVIVHKVWQNLLSHYWGINKNCINVLYTDHSFFFLFFCLLFLLYFTLQYCMVLPYIDMNPHGCTCVPKHEPPSHLPPHNISLGHHRAPAPSMLYPASDIDWWFDSYMIVYMLQFHSPKSSHPLPLPLSPKVRYTHLCLFCCLAYRVVIAIFLNSIYMC